MMRNFAVFGDRKSTRLNSSHLVISYAVFCLKKKKKDVWRSDQLGREDRDILSVVGGASPQEKLLAWYIRDPGNEVPELCFFFFFNLPEPPAFCHLPLGVALPF